MDCLSIIVTFIIVVIFTEFSIDTVERLCNVVMVNYRRKKGEKTIAISNRGFFK